MSEQTKTKTKHTKKEPTEFVFGVSIENTNILEKQNIFIKNPLQDKKIIKNKFMY